MAIHTKCLSLQNVQFYRIAVFIIYLKLFKSVMYLYIYGFNNFIYSTCYVLLTNYSVIR